ARVGGRAPAPPARAGAARLHPAHLLRDGRFLRGGVRSHAGRALVGTASRLPRRRSGPLAGPPRHGEGRALASDRPDDLSRYALLTAAAPRAADLPLPFGGRRA